LQDINNFSYFMKYRPGLLFLLVALFSAGVMADDQPDKKVVVVEGKKFIPLRNARHFYGTSKPMPIAVNKYVRQPMGHHGLAGPVPKPDSDQPKGLPATNNAAVNNNAAIPPGVPAPPPASAQHTGANNTAASKVLSIFSPEEQPQPPAPR
jgi:hypothetical protein